MENTLHSIGVTEEFRSKLEGIDPRFVREGILKARDQTWAVFHEIKAAIKVGMTEPEARKLSIEIFARHGVKKHWHQPSLRFGPGTAHTFYSPLQVDYRLQENDLVFVDLGPVWKDEALGLEYEGDVGDSFVFGKNETLETCVTLVQDWTRSLARRQNWKRNL
jgi:hypothetical protein